MAFDVGIHSKQKRTFAAENNGLMTNGWYQYKQWWAYYLRARTAYGIDAPFIFDFIEATLDNPRNYYALVELQHVRQQLLANDQIITVKDFGVGSHKLSQKDRKTSDIAQNSLSNAPDCRMLFNLVHWLKPENILEMGTSLGLSAMHLAAPNSRARVVTLEGDPAIANIAKDIIKQQQYKNIQVIQGEFSHTLPLALQTLGSLDMVFIDGNHRSSAVLDYFEQCLEYAHNDTAIILDDIYWSPDMTAAWTKIKAHPRVTLSVDLYYKGIVFLRTEQRLPRHYTLIARRYKPWQAGFFR